MLEPCIVIGCGGHSASVISIIESLECYEILGLVDVAEEFNPDERKSGYSVLFNLDELLNNSSKYLHIHCFIAIGDNENRARIYNSLKRFEFNFPNAISSYATVDRTVKFGDGNIIAHGVVINSQVKVEDNNLINTRSIIEHHSHLKSHSHIAPGAIICGNVSLSSFSFIGAGAVIVPHISVAEKFILGAGSVLVTNVQQANATFIGIPGKALTK